MRRGQDVEQGRTSDLLWYDLAYTGISARSSMVGTMEPLGMVER